MNRRREGRYMAACDETARRIVEHFQAQGLAAENLTPMQADHCRAMLAFVGYTPPE